MYRVIIRTLSLLSLLVSSLTAPLVMAQLSSDGNVLLPMVLNPAATKSYHVDCIGGNDSNSGLAQTAAWKTLGRAHQASLVAGDKLLFKRGCTWKGPLNLTWKGTSSQPITIDAYGSGYYPIIQNAGHYNVVITGSYLIIQNLYARTETPPARDANCQNQGIGWRVGFRFEPGAAYNQLRYSLASGNTHGVNIVAGAHHNRILNNEFSNNTLMQHLDQATKGNDAGANGVVIGGDDNEVAYNKIFGHDACSYDYGRDGSAIEIYGGQRNHMHHNNTWNNNTFAELGNPRSADNTFGYNLVSASIPQAQFIVSRGASDGFGPVMRTKVYNNSVYLTHSTSTGLNCAGGCGKDILILKNNIIWSEGRAVYTDVKPDEGNNIFWRSDGKPIVFFPTPQDRSPTSKIANPQFVKPSVGNGDFRLRAGSPAIDAGSNEALTVGYTTDFGTTPLYQGKSLDIGAYEYRP